MSETIAARDHDKPRFILPDNTFAIFQLKAGDDYHHLRFSSLKELNKQSARFRARIHDEVVKLYDMVFLDKSGFMTWCSWIKVKWKSIWKRTVFM